MQASACRGGQPERELERGGFALAVPDADLEEVMVELVIELAVLALEPEVFPGRGRQAHVQVERPGQVGPRLAVHGHAGGEPAVVHDGIDAARAALARLVVQVVQAVPLETESGVHGDRAPDDDLPFRPEDRGGRGFGHRVVGVVHAVCRLLDGRNDHGAVHDGREFARRESGCGRCGVLDLGLCRINGFGSRFFGGVRPDADRESVLRLAGLVVVQEDLVLPVVVLGREDGAAALLLLDVGVRVIRREVELEWHAHVLPRLAVDRGVHGFVRLEHDVALVFDGVPLEMDRRGFVDGRLERDEDVVRAKSLQLLLDPSYAGQHGVPGFGQGFLVGHLFQDVRRDHRSRRVHGVRAPRDVVPQDRELQIEPKHRGNVIGRNDLSEGDLEAVIGRRLFRKRPGRALHGDLPAEIRGEVELERLVGDGPLHASVHAQFVGVAIPRGPEPDGVALENERVLRVEFPLDRERDVADFRSGIRRSGRKLRRGRRERRAGGARLPPARERREGGSLRIIVPEDLVASVPQDELELRGLFGLVRHDDLDHAVVLEIYAVAVVAIEDEVRISVRVDDLRGRTGAAAARGGIPGLERQVRPDLFLSPGVGQRDFGRELAVEQHHRVLRGGTVRVGLVILVDEAAMFQTEPGLAIDRAADIHNRDVDGVSGEDRARDGRGGVHQPVRRR